MRKLFLLFLISFSAISCAEEPTPIEKYYGKGYVVLQEPYKYTSTVTKLRLKNPDTIFFVYVHQFDAQNLKVGDTLK